MKKMLCVFLAISMLAGLTLPVFAQEKDVVSIHHNSGNVIDTVHYYNNNQPYTSNIFEFSIKITNIIKYDYVYIQIDYDTELFEYYHVAYLSDSSALVRGYKTESGIYIKSTFVDNLRDNPEHQDDYSYSHVMLYVKKPGKVDFKITAYGIDLEGNKVDLDVEFENVITEVKAKYDASECQQGDVNCDGEITAADARRGLRIAAKLESYEESITKLADMDGNGKVTAADARKILRTSAGLT